jgi:hypothetical protein
MAISKINNDGNDIAIYGHAAWGVHEYLKDQFEINYFTLIRNPWEIFLSSYKYELAIKQYVGDIESYFKRYKHNMLVEYLGCGDTYLAAERLFSVFKCYGLKEEFQTSISYFT